MSTDMCPPLKMRRVVEMGEDGMCSLVDLNNLNEQINSNNCERKSGKHNFPSPKLEVPVLSMLPYQESSHTIPSEADNSVYGKSSLEMEGEFVEQAIDTVVSLPDAVSEVVLMQKDQSSEIHRQQLIRHTLKEKLKDAEKIHERAVEDIAHISRDIYLTENTVAQKKRLCESHETKLNSLVSEGEKLNSLNRQMDEEISEEVMMMKEYQEKMANYRTVMDEFEEEHIPERQQMQHIQAEIHRLKTLKQEIDDNRSDSKKVTSGEAAAELLQQEHRLQRESEETKGRIRKQKQQIDDSICQYFQVQKTVEVLHKRNAAQMTRLKRLIKEVKSANRQWQEQVIHLGKAVLQAKQQLE